MLTFYNPGEIDPRVITTLGVNVKPRSESPIGYFGTGLKYAIAGVLRLGGTIEIWSGLRHFTFTSEPQNIRGRSIDFIRMEEAATDQSWVLGFTTELGKDWTPWMIYRELWSNAKDEGGDVVEGDLAAAEGDTAIVVDLDLLDHIHSTQNEYILSNSTSLWSSPSVEIHKRESLGPLAYHSIRMNNQLFFKTTSLFTYNILGHEPLTEDRQFANIYPIRRLIVRAIMECTDAGLIRQILRAGRDFMEHDFDFTGQSVAPSEEFVAECLALLRDKPPTANTSAKRFIRSFRAQAADEAENALGGTWEEILAHAPKRQEDISDWSRASYQGDLEEALRAAIKEADYWRRVAAKLAEQPISAPKPDPAAEPETPF